MKVEERQMLYDALMKDTPDDPVILHEFEQLVNGDLDVLEPLIDKIMADKIRTNFKDSGWQELDLAIETVIPDGTTCVIQGRYQDKQFAVAMERTRLRDFAQYLAAEAER